MKLFGGKNSKQNDEAKLENDSIPKSGEMLEEDLYWEIIEKSLVHRNNPEAQEQFLVKEIQKLSPKEIIGFRLRTDKFLADTYTSEMWCAAYIMNGGCGDDGFEYFRNWLISRGKTVYYNAKANPDNLIEEVSSGQMEYDFEGFWYVALTAFSQKTGKDLYEHIDDTFYEKEGKYSEFEFTWKEEDPASMRAICPKLFAKMWH